MMGHVPILTIRMQVETVTSRNTLRGSSKLMTTGMIVTISTPHDHRGRVITSVYDVSISWRSDMSEMTSRGHTYRLVSSSDNATNSVTLRARNPTASSVAIR